MSNTNGFHPSSSSVADNEINDTSKRLLSISSASSTSSNSTTTTTTTNKRLKPKNIISTTLNETRFMKPNTIDLKKKRLIQSDSNNNNSMKKIKQSFRHQLEHIPSSNKKESHTLINNDYCDSCGECYGEMISCDTCPAIFHLLCTNPPLSRRDIPKGSYFCENCRTITTTTEEEFINKNKQEKIILPFSFDPKKILDINGSKKNQQYRSTLGQIKLPIASNGRSLVQPSGEIKFRPTNTISKSKLLSSSSSNLKRKRNDTSNSPVKIPNTQIEALRRLFLSCQSEEFHGPSSLFDNSTYNRDNHMEKNSLTCQKYCFICRKSSIKSGPSLQCDYCPLTYHLDCLTPPMTSLPSSIDKWMCPNHIEPILDRYLLRRKTFGSSERVKIYHQYSQIEQNTIIQDFAHMKHTKNYLTSKTINNHQLERNDISEIPKMIEEFYLKANTQQQQICKIEINDDKEDEKCEQTAPPSNESSLAYDPCVWDTLQGILNHIIDGHVYEFSPTGYSPIENNNLKKSLLKKDSHTLDTIDTLLNALNEPNYILESSLKNKTNDLNAADSCLNDEQKPISTSLTNSFSPLIDLSQFRLSHAALIHLRSQHVIYIRKHVIWFGSSSLNDICLKNFNHSQTCEYITERHACLYYDQKRNLFELLNYSEYGTIVNNLQYGLGTIFDDDDHKQENENLRKCFCLTQSSYQSAWDGPAQIDQGTVIKIGCHEFLFYRHIIR